MPVAKPTLGYPSRTAAVRALRRQGVAEREIAARIGIDVSTVYALGSDARRAAEASAVIRLPGDLAGALRDEAADRGRSLQQIVIDLLAAILADDLVDNVLDEEPSP